MTGSRHGEGQHRSAPALQEPSLSLDIQLVLDPRSRLAIRATFHYDPDAPLVVTVTFLVDGDPPIIWRIGRDLLFEGLYSLSGIADVQVWPTDDDTCWSVWLKVASPSATALFELPAQPLAAWLEHTYALVPAGQESGRMDWDAFAAKLTNGPDITTN